jgi:hypothetical protein
MPWRLLQINPRPIGPLLLLAIGLAACCDTIEVDVPRSAFKDEKVRLFYEEHMAMVLRKGEEHKVVLMALWPDTNRLRGSSAPCYQLLPSSYKVVDRGILVQFEDSTTLSKYFDFSRMNHPVEVDELSSWIECPAIPGHFEPVFSEIHFLSVGIKD